ncbi:MAG: proline dehydrogenase family protein, partial [Methylomonas sp.]
MNANRLRELRKQISHAFIQSEAETIADLESRLGNHDQQPIVEFSKKLITSVRARHARRAPFEAFLQEYSLSSEEGIVLMGIAEALLRIPDIETQSRFLQEKLADADWHRHLLHSDSLLVNLASHALLVGGRIEDKVRHAQQSGPNILDGLLLRLGEPLIRTAVKQSVQQLAQHFVIAENIGAAIRQAAHNPTYRYSFDMLGEAALTESDAEHYYQAYFQAIQALA